MAKQNFDDRCSCHICGSPYYLEWHHIFNGVGLRRLSTKYGCCCYLCRECHQGDKGVHNNRELADKLKAECEAWFLKKYQKTVEEFISIFGRNYL